MQSKAHSPSLLVRCMVSLFLAAAVIAAPAQNSFFTTLLTFDTINGCTPTAGLVQGTDGNFYGTTNGGGSGSYCEGSGCGTVFKTTSAGTLTTLYNFCSQANCADGSGPSAGLVQATDGNFYGTTGGGGAFGNGTVFKITAAGTLTTLYNFCSQANCADGSGLSAGLVQATDGNFYGTTGGGGAFGNGTVFKITAAGTLTTLFSFCALGSPCADGSSPYAGLFQASDGNFYGTTEFGGTNDAGTVFRITAAGTLTTLYSFCSQRNCTDGNYPWAGLIQATDADFYGTTSSGGTYGQGTAFKITAQGMLTTLHSLAYVVDGSAPVAGLVQASDGNFYGTAAEGGVNRLGTLFLMTPTGTLTKLHDFDGTDGNNPFAGLVQGSDGNFYGTTTGLNISCGTVFRLGAVRACATCRP